MFSFIDIWCTEPKNSKSFIVACHLKTPEWICTGKHAYSCDVRNKLFTYHSILKSHECLLTGECPFTCKVSNKYSLTNVVWRNSIYILESDHIPVLCVYEKSFRYKDIFGVSSLYTSVVLWWVWTHLIPRLSCTEWHKKTGTFEKRNKNWRNPRKKNLLTEIESLQLAF